MKSEHTKGKVESNYTRPINADGVVICECFKDGQSGNEWTPSIKQAKANAQLIADAFNVANETGMTPRELQKSHAELLDALENLLTKTELYHDFSSHVIEARRSAWKAIDNATKNKNT